MDYGHPIRFGIFPSPRADSSQEALQMARVADEAGLDLVAIQDHPYQRRFLDTWALLAYLAGRTERIALVPDVANLPLRPPAVMAGAAASIDVLSGGRFELGLGAGAFWDAIAAMGGPRARWGARPPPGGGGGSRGGGGWTRSRGRSRSLGCAGGGGGRWTSRASTTASTGTSPVRPLPTGSGSGSGPTGRACCGW